MITIFKNYIQSKKLADQFKGIEFLKIKYLPRETMFPDSDFIECFKRYHFENIRHEHLQEPFDLIKKITEYSIKKVEKKLFLDEIYGLTASKSCYEGQREHSWQNLRSEIEFCHECSRYPYDSLKDFAFLGIKPPDGKYRKIGFERFKPDQDYRSDQKQKNHL